MNPDERRRRATTRVGRIHDDAGALDRAFWDALPAHERLEAVWDMALDYLELRGERGHQRGLQRSVCRVERRGR